MFKVARWEQTLPPQSCQEAVWRDVPESDVLKSKMASYHHLGMHFAIGFVGDQQNPCCHPYVSHVDTISEFSSNKQSVSLEHQPPIDSTFAFQDSCHTSLCRLYFPKSLRACQPPACKRVDALKNGSSDPRNAAP